MKLARSGIPANEIGDPPGFYLCTQLMARGDLAGAEEVAADLLRRYPQHAEAAYVLSLMAHWQHPEPDNAKAERIAREVLRLRPNFAECWHNLGIFLQRQGKDDEAIDAYQRCLKLNPTSCNSLVNLGNAMLARGRTEEAIAFFTKAMDSEQTDPLARYNRSLAFLLTGRWKEGWDDYESRGANPNFAAKCPIPPYLCWDGTPQPGKRLLVVSEQGIGDTIMCWRYRDKLQAVFRGEVTWRVQPELICLLPGTIPHEGDWQEADFFLLTMSLMHRLGMPENGAPYIQPPHSLKVESASPRIGYVWAGSATHESDRRRSCPRELWDDLLSLPGIQWKDMQVGRGGSYQPKDWAHTARDLAGLSLLITVDTAIAHLAGAMGVPVWILVSSWPDYRWQYTGERTLWYDSARLIRQRNDGDWAELLRRVKGMVLAWQGVE